MDLSGSIQVWTEQRQGKPDSITITRPRTGGEEYFLGVFLQQARAVALFEAEVLRIKEGQSWRHQK